MQTQSLKPAQVPSKTVNLKPLLDQVDEFLHKMGNQISVLHFDAEEIEKELLGFFGESDGNLKLEAFGALQKIRKVKTNLEIFIKNK